ncbi:MAG: hypothetical protein COZ46_01355 [Verrucomicrobia bacterium CG_4_10_14_3_um_filter_43_23]|nr:MAG: hypothetical protein AUJ82_01390 [Verrucomicrobia bacterium CG1_02_43_26]PIP59546.1 MAG: hypothetical protein COX01_02960 [Verrucomicrobia bacterium CG22_combo_CG10-13_8_21_14_all_43_17]PIX58847.1 MAG: hypothetical protein COZ46_01355 [Verrucomicrobia bacterium CG_4_10_14_3_um_filter_43_23]PIY60942.1 MAG: hypothetical protein COY94_08035 [Verrucomicrobia bacterium CG_4_10_14_0_8_um_filter_43_34]PJA44856.1 MAG: hypothetical protein CO175_00845 [Verrucomicrobia bacterium CG_4_9_14_3_um_fi
MKKQFFWLSLFLGVVMGSTLLAATDVKTVAVIPFKSTDVTISMSKQFTNMKWSQKDTEYLTSEVITALVNNPNFKVVERQGSRLKALEEEKKFSSMTAGGMSAFGKEIGAQYLVYGDIELVEAEERPMRFESSNVTVTELTGRMIVSMRIVDVATSEIVLSKKVNQEALERVTQYSRTTPLSFMNLLKEWTVKRLVNEISNTISPIKIASIDKQQVYLNQGEGSVFKIGSVLDVFETGEKIVNPDTGEFLGTQERQIGAVRVSRIMPKFAVADLVSSAAPFAVGYVCRLPQEKYIHANIEERPVSPLSSDKPVNW